MKDIEKPFENFRSSTHVNLFNILRESKLLPEELAESTTHALIDISESIETIYMQIIPEIIKCNAKEKEKIDALLFDLKQEFSHILYHIEDAKLEGLRYWE